MKFRRTNKVGKFEVKKVKIKGAVSKLKMSFVLRSVHAPFKQVPCSLILSLSLSFSLSLSLSLFLSHILQGPDCCSDLSISFHYVQPFEMYVLYFYVYRWHPYGTFISDSHLPPPGKFLYRKNTQPSPKILPSSRTLSSSSSKPVPGTPSALRTPQ